jgi:hypothetical protein
MLCVKGTRSTRRACCRSLPVPFSAVATSSRRRTVEFRLDRIDRCSDARWFFGGEERTINDYGRLVLFLDDLEKCTATDLQAALRRARKLCRDYLDDPLQVVILEDDFYDEDVAVLAPGAYLPSTRSLDVSVKGSPAHRSAIEMAPMDRVRQHAVHSKIEIGVSHCLVLRVVHPPVLLHHPTPIRA